MPDGPHGGAVTARDSRDGNRVAISEDDRKVRLQPPGNLLVVADDLQCGGLNASFSGVHRQTPAARR